MQQAARVSQRTAFFHLGKLVEEGDTDEIFTNPQGQAHAGLHHRPLRLMLRLLRPFAKPPAPKSPATRPTAAQPTRPQGGP